MSLLASDRTTAAAVERRLDRYGLLALWTVPVVWVLWAAVTGAVGSTSGTLSDALQYYLAGKAFLVHWDPYVHASGPFIFPFFPFRQWPLVTALCAPTALLPVWAAKALWALLCGAGVGVGFWCLWRRLAEESAQPPVRWLAAVALAPGSLAVLALGQMSGLCFGCYALGLCLVRQRPWLAGFAFALIGAKPHLALLAIPALLAAAPTAWGTFAVGMLCWPLGSLLVAGPTQLREYVDLLVRQHADNGGSMVVAVPISYVLPPGTPRTIGEVVCFGFLCCLFIGLLVYRLRTGTRLSSVAIDAATAIVLAGLPYAVLYDLPFIASAILRLGARPTRRSRLLLAAWWLVPIAGLILLTVKVDGAAGVLPPAVAVTALTTATRGSLFEVPPRVGAGFKPATARA